MNIVCLNIVVAVVNNKNETSKKHTLTVRIFGNEKKGIATSMSNNPHSKNPPHHIPTHLWSPGSTNKKKEKYIPVFVS